MKTKKDIVLFDDENEIFNLIAHPCAEFNLLYSLDALSGDGDILAQYSEHYGEVVEQLRFKQNNNDKIGRLVDNMDTLLSKAPTYPYSIIGYVHMEQWQLQALEKAYNECRHFINPLFLEIELLPPTHIEDTVVHVVVPKGTRGMYRRYEGMEEDNHVLLIGRNQRLTLIIEPFYNDLDNLKEYVIAIEPE
jgi:hypothetical protein